MPHAADEHSLASRRHTTLILRLTLDHRRRLVQGELVDMTETLHQRFSSLAGLNKALQGWLTDHVQSEDGSQGSPAPREE